MESVEVITTSPVSADVRLMMSHSRTAGGNTADPTGASSEHKAFPTEENSPTEKQKRKKNKGIRAFFQRIGKAVCHIFSCDEDDIGSPFPCSDPTDVQPDLSGLQLALSVDPCQSGIELPVNGDPEPSPVPGPSTLDSEIPDQSGLGPAFVFDLWFVENQTKKWRKKGIRAFLRRRWRTIKRSVRGFRKSNKVAPDLFADEPVAHQDPTDQTDPEPLSVSSPSTLDSGIAPAVGSISSFYEVKRELGRGGFGIVCEGMRRFDGQKVAIKFLPKSSRDKFIELPASTKPLFAEVAVNLLMRQPPKSPHIVQMLDWFDQPEQYVLIMEYPHPCETLLKFTMRNGGLLDETMARGLMRQAVLAAKHVVDQDVYHKDIKMDNILVNTETLQLKLIDFGCSELFKTSKGREWVVRSTVWSLGRVLLEIVSGFQPLNVLQSGKLNPLRPSLSDECQDLIKQCLDLYTTSLTLEQILEHAWFEQD